MKGCPEQVERRLARLSDERMVLKHERFSAWPERRLDVRPLDLISATLDHSFLPRAVYLCCLTSACQIAPICQLVEFRTGQISKGACSPWRFVGSRGVSARWMCVPLPYFPGTLRLATQRASQEFVENPGFLENPQKNHG